LSRVERAASRLPDAMLSLLYFKVELVTVTPRTHYRVKVTPPAGVKPQQAVILLRAVGAVPTGAGLTFYARMK